MRSVLASLASVVLFASHAIAAAPPPAADPAAAERLEKLVESAPEPGYALTLLLDWYRAHRGGLDPLVEKYHARTAADPKAAAPWLVLGHVLGAKGAWAEAAAAFAEAGTRAPKDARPLLWAAAAWKKLGEPARAREALEAALGRAKAGAPTSSGGTVRGDVLRALAELALDGGDLALARKRYAEVVRAEPWSAEVRFELPRALAARGKTADALAEYEALARAAGTDVKTRVRALASKGALLEERGDFDGAIAAYREAAKVVKPGHWLARELDERIVGAHRKRDDLAGLVAWYEGRGAGLDFHGRVTLGKLYEETGRDDDAIAAYKKALAARPGAVEVRVRLVEIYGRIGRTAERLAEYERLVAAAPDEPRWRVEHASALWTAGERKKALATLAALKAHRPRDASALLLLADLYARWGERPRAIDVYETLVAVDPGEEAHRIALGELYWQEGRHDAAIAAWNKLAATGPDRATGHVRAGDVLGEHGLVEAAMVHFDDAERLRPGEVAPARGRALALERDKRWDDARAAWEEALRRAIAKKADGAAAESRDHLVEVLHRAGTLAAAALRWREAFEADPPDAEAGRLLAIALGKLGEPGAAAGILADLVRVGPDPSSLASLERLHVAAERWRDAVEVAERLAAADPARAKDAYARIAEYWANLYDDAKSLEWARKAVELSPTDAKAWERLGTLHARMRDRAGAAAAFEKAVALAPRDFKLVFALCDLLGDDPRADALLVDVMARAGEEADVLRAGRRAIRRATEPARAAALEAALLADYHWRPKRAFRTLLVELYSETVPAASRAAVADPAARAALKKSGERALKPLVDALTDEEGMSRAVATELLGLLGHPGAALPLARLLEDRDVGLRLRAAAALGRLGDLRGAAPLARALADGEPSVRMAAAWALGAIPSPKTVDHLSGKDGVGTRDPRTPVRTVAAMALGVRGDAAAVKALLPLLDDRDPFARRAAALALARLGAREAAPALRAWLARGVAGEMESPSIRRTAAVALGRIGDAGVVPVLLAALWDGDVHTRKAAVGALVAVLASPAVGGRKPAGGGPLAADPTTFFDARSGRFETDAMLVVMERETGAEGDAAAAARALLGEHRDVALAAWREALASDDPRRARAARDLDFGAATVALGPLTATLPADALAALQPALDLFGEDLAPAVADALAKAEGAATVALLARVAGKTRATVVTPALAAAAAAADPAVRAAVAEGLGRVADPTALGALRALARDPDFGVRAAAVRSLGAMRSADAVPACAAALSDDRFALVREAAALALADIGPAAASAAPALLAALRHEAPSVRAASAAALGAAGVRAAIPALGDLARDPDARVRAAAAAALGALGAISAP